MLGRFRLEGVSHSGGRRAKQGRFALARTIGGFTGQCPLDSRPVNKSHKRRDSITAFSSGNRDTVPKFNETLERTTPTKTKGKPP